MKKWFRNYMVMLGAILILTNSGCSNTTEEVIPIDESINETLIPLQDKQEEIDKITQIYCSACDKVELNSSVVALEWMRSLVEQYGQNGYAAIDSKNQINMTEPDQVIRFCEAVKDKSKDELIIVEISYSGGIVIYNLQTQEGSVNVTRSYYKYGNGEMQKMVTGSYEADYFAYTEEGYLMFSGTWFSEELYVLTLSGKEENTAFRVQPLDESYRELSRMYIQPFGFEQNNMFLVNWSEDDFGNLDFYDLYDICYELINGRSVPYQMDDNLGVGAVYRIPANEFESVIQTYFDIDNEMLRTKTTYHAEDDTYEYKPRGFYEVEYPEYPYSEVVDFTENEDGTITLLANVVFPYAGISKVYAHEVVVRPLDNGDVQYVSNRVLPSEENYEVTWHTPRLTQDEWEEVYVDEEVWKSPVEIAAILPAEEASTEYSEDTAYWFIPQAGDSLISDEEKEQLESKVLSATESVSGIYKEADIVDAPSYDSGVNNFTDEQCRAVVKELGKNGYVSVEENTNMQNYHKMEQFYEDYLNKQDSQVTILEVHQDGLIGAVTFIYRQGKLQTYYVGIRWQEGGIPEIQGTSISDVAENKLTEKGYFIYAYEELISHSSLRQYWRVKPLSDQCRELTQKYISGLSYVNYNMLVTNWDSSNVEDILMPCMYEDIYRIYTGENLRVQGERLPGEVYEKIMTRYFPVSVEQLRTNCGYEERSNTYQYEMIFSKQYPPFGEVVDYTENADGTLTLIVDGVWPDYNSDLAFTNQITVQPFEDGTFRYLSNSIEQKELELPPIAKRN